MLISVSVSFYSWHSGGKGCLAYILSTNPKHWQARCQALENQWWVKQNWPGLQSPEVSLSLNPTLSSHERLPHYSICKSLPFLNSCLHFESVSCHMTYMLFCSILESFQQFVLFLPWVQCSVNHNSHFYHWSCKSPLVYYILSPYYTPIPLPILSNHSKMSTGYLFIARLLAKWALPSLHIKCL